MAKKKKPAGLLPEDMDDRSVILTEKDAIILRKAGFTHWEIDMFSQGAGGSGPIRLHTGTWRDVIQTRREMVRNIREYFDYRWGDVPTRRERDRIIMNWYHLGMVNDPWVWVQLAYHPPATTEKRIDAIDTLRERARRRTRALRVGDIDDYLGGIAW